MRLRVHNGMMSLDLRIQKGSVMYDIKPTIHRARRRLWGCL